MEVNIVGYFIVGLWIGENNECYGYFWSCYVLLNYCWKGFVGCFMFVVLVWFQEKGVKRVEVHVYYINNIFCMFFENNGFMIIDCWINWWEYVVMFCDF